MTLPFTAITFDALRPLALRHRWLVQVLVAFAGPSGRCWPSLVAIAEQAGEHVSWVRRNIEEVLLDPELDYFTREPREGGGYTYTIAERFLPKRGKPVAVPTVKRGVPTVGTEEHLEEQVSPPLPPPGGDRKRRREEERSAPGGSHAASAVPKTGQPAAPLVAAGEAVREEIRQRAELRWFFEAGRWSERQGPRPGEEGCRYPAAMISDIGGKIGHAKAAPPAYPQNLCAIGK